MLKVDRWKLKVDRYAAFVTLFERRQRVQTRIRLIPPLMIARTT